MPSSINTSNPRVVHYECGVKHNKTTLKKEIPYHVGWTQGGGRIESDGDVSIAGSRILGALDTEEGGLCFGRGRLQGCFAGGACEDTLGRG